MNKYKILILLLLLVSHRVPSEELTQAEKTQLNKKLIKAIKKKDFKKLNKLLEKGANVNSQDKLGWTALMEVAFQGHLEITNALLEIEGINVNAQDIDGWTALMIAADQGHLEIVKALLKKGADTKIKNSKGETALQLAKDNEHHDIVNILTPTCADLFRD